jgi:glycerol kinase
VVRPLITETTALGAAYLAGLAVGVWRDENELASLWQAERRFEPHMPAADVAAIKARWQEAVSRCRGWASA